MNHLRPLLHHAPSRAIGLVFGINGVVFGTWITRIPEIKGKLALSDADLGLALFGVPLGAFLIMPLMGRITDALGAGRATLWSAYLLCLTIFLPALAPDFWVLGGALLVFGAVHGGMDIAMNATAARVEQEHRLNIMSACHGCWSLGGMLGASTGSLAYGMGIPFLLHLLLVCGLMVIVAVSQRRALRPIRFQRSEEPLFALPGKALLVFALVGFCIMFGEGAIADWSALYMTDSLGADALLAGAAYAGFSLAMALGRFFGDGVMARYGARPLITCGSLLSALCLGGLLAWGHPLTAVLGFTLSGIGFAVIVPVLFSEAAKVPGMVPGASIAAVGSLGYLGLLAGPPLLGLVSERWSLPLAMALVAALCLLAAGLIQLRPASGHAASSKR